MASPGTGISAPYQLMLKLKQAEAKASIDCLGIDLIKNEAHALLALALLTTYGAHNQGFLYFESSTVCSTNRLPDAVLCTRQTGVVVIECKGYEIQTIDSVQAGSLLVRRRGEIKAENVFDQVRNTMFAIKNSVDRLLSFQPNGPLFSYLVALPRITRDEWRAKNFELNFPRTELLLADDLEVSVMRRKIQVVVQHGLNARHRPTPLQSAHLPIVRRAFGDSTLVNAVGADRGGVLKDTIGEAIADYESSDKLLSEEQRTLCELRIGEFPRVIRGVAGSGKTAVLARQVARYIAVSQAEQSLFHAEGRKVAVLCYNRALVPLLRQQIERAYRKRVGGEDSLPPISVVHMNALMYQLSSKQGSPIRYIRTEGRSGAERAQSYLHQIECLSEAARIKLQSLLFDAIFIDEGQDLEIEEFRLLLSLLRPHPVTGEKCPIIFYDDSQNLYARTRPVWKEIGMDVQRGDRSRIMKHCFRNTREVITLAFNVLVGSASENRTVIGTRTYANLAELLQTGLVDQVESGYCVHFAERTFRLPDVRSFSSRIAEYNWVCSEIKRLLQVEHVLAQDILVLCHSHGECARVAQILREVNLAGIEGFRHPHQEAEKDDYIFADKQLTVTTIKSAKVMTHMWCFCLTLKLLRRNLKDGPASTLEQHGQKCCCMSQA